MESKIEGTNKISLEIKGHEIELTMDEAINLRCLLNRLTGSRETYFPVEPICSQPSYPWTGPTYDYRLDYMSRI